MRNSVKLIVVMMFLVSIVGATTLGTYKEGDCINLIQICGNCTYNNISTVLYPNSSIALDQTEMTRADTYYSNNFCNTNTSGTYIINGFGDIDGTKTSWNYDLLITPSGNALTTSSAITYGLMLIIMFGVTIFFLIFAKLTEVAGVKLFFNLIGYVTMILTVGSGYILLQSSGVQSSMGTSMSALIFIVGIVFVIIMFYVLINQTRQALQLMKVKKGFGSEFENDNNLF